MAWNLNNYNNEYQLFKSQTEENIAIFGLTVSYIKAKGQNLDTIFGEYTHKKIEMQNVYNNVPVLPENSEDFETLGNTFSKFGFTHTETFNCYISATEADKLGYNIFRIDAIGDIIVLPNGKKFEISFIEHEVPGQNNMFTYSNTKNVYLVKTNIWSYNGDESDIKIESLPEDSNLTQFDFRGLDGIFNIPNDEEITLNEQFDFANNLLEVYTEGYNMDGFSTNLKNALLNKTNPSWNDVVLVHSEVYDQLCTEIITSPEGKQISIGTMYTTFGNLAQPTNAFTIELSNDGVNWKIVYELEDDVYVPMEHIMSGVGKFLRLKINKKYDMWARLYADYINHPVWWEITFIDEYSIVNATPSELLTKEVEKISLSKPSPFGEWD